MKPEAQRIALCAVVPNWRVADPSGISSLVHWIHADGTQMLSDPLDDLNAMHEAEKTLPNNGTHEGGRFEYYLKLTSLCGGVMNNNIFATAAQRAEAFLRTIGKWEESA